MLDYVFVWKKYVLACSMSNSINLVRYLLVLTQKFILWAYATTNSFIMQILLLICSSVIAKSAFAKEKFKITNLVNKWKILVLGCKDKATEMHILLFFKIAILRTYKTSILTDNFFSIQMTWQAKNKK